MTDRNLHPTDDSPRARSERHRARRIPVMNWLREVNSFLRALQSDLTQDERNAMAAELLTPGSELERIVADSLTCKTGRPPAADVAGCIYLTVVHRRFAAPPAKQAERPEWEMY